MQQQNRGGVLRPGLAIEDVQVADLYGLVEHLDRSPIRGRERFGRTRTKQADRDCCNRKPIGSHGECLGTCQVASPEKDVESSDLLISGVREFPLCNGPRNGFPLSQV